MAKKVSFNRMPRQSLERLIAMQGHGSNYRSQYPSPDFFFNTAWSYLYPFVTLGGARYEQRIEELSKPIPGTSPNLADITPDPLFPALRRANFRILAQGIAAAMQGRMPNLEQETAFQYCSHWLLLPRNLKDFAFAYIVQANYFGKPQDAVDTFKRSYFVLVHPVFQERFLNHKITADDIQQVFRNHPELDPVESTWLLSTGMDVVQVNDKLEFEIHPTLKQFARLVLGPKLREDQDPTDVLLGFDESPLARARCLEADSTWRMQQIAGLYARNLVKGNHLLNEKRAECTERFCRIVLQLAPTQENNALTLHQLLDLCAERIGAEALTQYLFAWYPEEPVIFTKSTLRRANLPLHSWADVPHDLQTRFKTAGFADELAILNKIVTETHQLHMRVHPAFVVRNSCGQSGFIVSSQQMLRALTKPEAAYFAEGTAIDPFYAKMYALAGADMDFDTFWGITRPPLDTPEKQMTAAFHMRVTEALSNAEIFKNCISNEQISYFLGVSPDQYRALFEKPYNNYSIPRGAPEPVPSEAMSVVERELGVSFREEWQTLHTARVGAAKVLEQRAAAEAAARQAALQATQPKAMPDPWKGVDAGVVAAIKTKFETPEALSGAIFEQIRSMTTLDERVATRLPGMIAQEVDFALRSKVAGVSGDYLPLDIMHARILAAMEPAHRDAAKAIFEARPKAQGIDVHKQSVLANIAALAIQNPRLAAFLNWRQLRNGHAKANVPDLTDNLVAAYTLRSQRDHTLRTRDSLAGIVETLNLGLEQSLHCSAEGIVPIDTWRAVAKIRSGQDPLPKGAASTNFTTQPN
jgi:hypothetical protein